MVLVAVSADAQHGVPVGAGAPQRAAIAGGPPSGLVHVQALGGAHTHQQILVGVLECVGDPLQDAVHGAA